MSSTAARTRGRRSTCFRVSKRTPARAGGAVHALLGNHEIMRMLGDLRFATPGEYAAFVTARSEEVRQRFVESAPAEERAQLLKETPLGSIEMRVAFGREGAVRQVAADAERCREDQRRAVRARRHQSGRRRAVV